MSPETDAVNVIGDPCGTLDGQLTETVGHGGLQPVQSAIVTVAEPGTGGAVPSLTLTVAV